MLRIKSGFPLKKLNTFSFGGRVSFYAEINIISDLEEIVSFSKAKKLPIVVLGEGSNILVTDDTLNAIAIRLKNRDTLFLPTISGTVVTCGAGLHWDKLVSLCVKRGLNGVECLSGIPGTVGAAPVQNIGAYGQELKDTFYNLKAYDLSNDHFVVLSGEQCKFGYRDSIFKKKGIGGNYIIWEVSLKLLSNNQPRISYESLRKCLFENKIASPSLSQIRKCVLELRNAKLEDPRKVPNAGSFFKNPLVSKLKFRNLLKKYPDVPGFSVDDKKIKLFAGWLIERAGWRGRKYKNVAVSSKNALVLVNPIGKGTAREILDLSDMIIKDVMTKFGVKLEPEVQRVYSTEL